MIPLVIIKRLESMGSRRIVDYLTRNAQRLVRIYSREHHTWWLPDGCGYTQQLHLAGIYTLADALDRTHHCDASKCIYYAYAKEIFVPIPVQSYHERIACIPDQTHRISTDGFTGPAKA